MADERKKVQVGLVMPIAQIENCGPEHWLEVKSIIIEALSNHEKYHFETKLVSESDSIGLIHKRIVQGLYNSHIVICDVSCKNPNVMFELGMRLAFDKPTIIIKDDKTNYTFDAGGIEHVEYPRDLRFSRIVEFKSILLKKTIATYEDSLNDPNHSPFLKSFGEFKVAKLDETEVTPHDLIFEKLAEIQSDVAALKLTQLRPNDSYIRTDNQLPLDLRALKFLERVVKQYLDELGPDEDIRFDDLINHVNRALRSNDLINVIPQKLISSYLKDVLQRDGRSIMF
jgi:hypothetical protein